MSSGEYQATRSAFRTALHDRGVSTVPATGGVIVRIDDERSYRRPISTTAAIDAAEYELRIEVDIAIVANGNAVMATLVSEKTYSVDRSNLSGSYEEQSMLLAEMRRELASRMIRRVEALTGNPGSG